MKRRKQAAHLLALPGLSLQLQDALDGFQLDSTAGTPEVETGPVPDPVHRVVAVLYQRLPGVLHGVDRQVGSYVAMHRLVHQRIRVGGADVHDVGYLLCR